MKERDEIHLMQCRVFFLALCIGGVLLVGTGCRQGVFNPVTPDLVDYRSRIRFDLDVHEQRGLRWEEDENLDSHYEYLKDKYLDKHNSDWRVSPGEMKYRIWLIEQYEGDLDGFE